MEAWKNGKLIDRVILQAMDAIVNNLKNLLKTVPSHVKLVAVTKTASAEQINELYGAGYRIFGENRVQDMVKKYEVLPKNIEWHMIGHLQTNKVKYIASFISLIHSVDDIKLLREINKQAEKNNRVIDCLLQIYIAKEETKFGIDFNEAEEILISPLLSELNHIRICGLMGMATNTEDVVQVRSEFRSLASFFNKIKSSSPLPHFSILSMGMTQDYKIAIEEGSTIARVGSAIFL